MLDIKTPCKVTLPIFPVKAIKNDTLHRLANLKLNSLGLTADWEPVSQYYSALGAITVTSPVSQDKNAINHNCWSRGPIK